MARNRNGNGSERRITARCDRLLDILVHGAVPTIREAGEAAGLSERGTRKALAQPHVKAELDRRIKERLQAHSFPKAAAVLHNLLNADSEYVRADVAKHVLGVHGVRASADSAPASAGAGIKLVINLPGSHASGQNPGQHQIEQRQVIDVTPIAEQAHTLPQGVRPPGGEKS